MLPNATVVQELRATCTATGTWEGQGISAQAICVDDNFPRYIIADVAQSCTQACAARDLACSESRGREIDTGAEFTAVLQTLINGNFKITRQ